jgi:hypothetical protein
MSRRGGTQMLADRLRYNPRRPHADTTRAREVLETLNRQFEGRANGR